MKKHITRLDIFINGTTKLFYCYLLLLIIMSLFRVGFIFYYAPVGTIQSHLFDTIKAALIGIRFDTMVINYLLSIPFILITLASLFRTKFLFEFSNMLNRWLLFFGSFCILFLLITDFGFYSFFQDHINILFFGLWDDDSLTIIQTVWNNYPVVKVGLFVTAVFIGIHIVIKKIFQKQIKSQFNKGIIKYILSIAIVFSLIFIGARGGIEKSPLPPQFSEVSENEFVNQIALNGIITLQNAIDLRNKRNNTQYRLWEKLGYKGKIQKAFSDYLEFETRGTKENGLTQLMFRQTLESNLLEENPPNVVIIVMESFGQFWHSFNSNEFNLLGDLKNHFDNDILFNNFLSSDNETIGSLLSIGLSMPMRSGSQFMTESEQANVSLGSAINKPFKKNKYETSFIYGGKLSFKNIGDYFKTQGFKNIVGEKSIIKNHLGKIQATSRGVHDEYLFKYIEEQLTSLNSPQMIMALTTSNHPPFEVPKTFKPLSLKVPVHLQERVMRDKELFKQRLIAYQYANQSVARFLTNLKDSELGRNTIVAITGDHNFFGFLTYKDEELFQKYRVPFYLYVPEKYRPSTFNSDKFGSHEDIAPTLINLSLSKTRYLTFGRDLFGTDKTFSINTKISANKDGVIEKDYYYQWSNTLPLIRPKKVQENMPKLKTYRNAILSITDFYIKEKAN